MDKAAIFADVTKRNALRSGNGLPLLNVHAEYTHEVSVVRQRDYRAACDEHAGEREDIRQQVLVEYRERFGPQFGKTMGGRWVVGRLIQKRFAALMAEKYSLLPPDQAIGRNSVTYGKGLKAWIDRRGGGAAPKSL